jgi:hypothetical protein
MQRRSALLIFPYRAIQNKVMLVDLLVQLGGPDGKRVQSNHTFPTSRVGKVSLAS